MRLPRFAVPLFLLSALALFGAGAGAAVPQARAASDCTPFEVVGARGSGQDKVKEMRMGPEVHDFYLTLSGLLGGGVVSGHGVPYDAVSIDPLKSKANFAGAALHIGALGEYTDSVEGGRQQAETWIEERHKQCRDTRFILAGYSQGAQALGDLLQRNGDVRKLVAAAAFFGDPYFDAESWSARSVSELAPGAAGFDPGAYGIFGSRGEWDPSLHGRVFSYCHFHDYICNITNRVHIPYVGDAYVRNPKNISFSAHNTPAYRLTTVKGGRGDAGLAARDVAKALGFTPAPIPYSGPLDIAFAIDSTGSMLDEIDEVKTNVTALAGQIAAIDPDYRLALVDYKDSPEQESLYQSRLDTDFTTDIASFDRQLSTLQAEGGGDTAESVYAGVMRALSLDWRAGAKKIVVQIGDAAAKDPEPVTGYTLRAVQAKALAVDPATVDAIQSGEDTLAKASFSALASATGGEFLQLPETDLKGLVPAIANDIRRNTTAPAAALSTPFVALAGQPVTLSAAASHDVGEPIGGYDWDFNGDGSFDASSTDPVFNYTYPAPFSGTVVVRVRSVSGLSSLATAPLTVTAPAAKPPAKPSHLRKTLKGSKLELSWSAGRGPAPQWFTLLGRHGRVLERAMVSGDPRRTGKGKRRLFVATIHGLRAGHEYRFAVAAGNSAGESGRAGPVVVRLAAPDRQHRRGPGAGK